MKLSTKGRYAARAMVDMALHYQEAPILLRDIAEREQIFMHYLEQLFVQLRAAGLVKSTRGAQGGFTLAKPPSQIKLSEGVQTLEGPLALVPCIDDATTCERASFCVTRDIWGEMGTAMSKVLESVSLHDLVERQRKKEQPKTITY